MNDKNYSLDFASDADWMTIQKDIINSIPTVPLEQNKRNEWIGIIGLFREAGLTFDEVKALNFGNTDKLSKYEYDHAPYGKHTKLEARKSLYCMAKGNGYALPFIPQHKNTIHWTDTKTAISHNAFRSDSYTDLMQSRIEDAKKLLHILFGDDGKFYVSTNCPNFNIHGFTCRAIPDSFFTNLYFAKKGAYLMLNTVNDDLFKQHPNGINKGMMQGFKYLFIESDSMTKEAQKQALEKLDLPWIGMVWSGSKSIHTIVRLDASNEAELVEHLQKIHKYLDNNNYEYDKSINYSSKWMRFPVAGRDNDHQYVLAINDNPCTYAEWLARHPELKDKVQTGFIVNGKLDKTLFVDYLYREGYRKILNSNKEIELVKINGKFISKETSDSIVFSIDSSLKQSLTKEDYNAVFNAWDKFMSRVNDQKFYALDNVELTLHTDTKDAAYLYFANGYLEVNANSTALHSYNDIEGYIWDDTYKSAKQEYQASDGKQSVFEQFIRKISSRFDDDGILRESPEEYDRMRSAIGYMISRYKNPVCNPAVYITDRKADGESDNSSGGTGKDLMLEAVNHLRSSGIMDGRTMDVSQRFAFSAYQEQNSLYIFRDIQPSLRIESLYNKITNGMEIEKKGENKFTVPFDKMPKVIFTSNFYLKNMNTTSTRRRLFFLILENVYNDKHTPYDDFHCCFYRDWDNAEWNRFYDFMAGCIQCFLTKGLKANNDTEIEEKIKDSSTNEVLKIWLESTSNAVDNIKAGIAFNFNDKFLDYQQWYQDHRLQSGVKTPGTFRKEVKDFFGNRLKRYCSGDGQNKRMWILEAETSFEDEAPF